MGSWTRLVSTHVQLAAGATYPTFSSAEPLLHDRLGDNLSQAAYREDGSRVLHQTVAGHPVESGRGRSHVSIVLYPGDSRAHALQHRAAHNQVAQEEA